MNNLVQGFEYSIDANLILLRFKGYWRNQESKRWKDAVCNDILKNYNGAKPIVFADLRSFKMGSIESFRILKNTNLHAYRELKFNKVVILTDQGKGKVMEIFVRSVSLQHVDANIVLFETIPDLLDWFKNRKNDKHTLVETFVNK